MEEGIYFSANDAVLPWARAFLTSFRMYNPGTHLILIPFDENCSDISRLRSQYSFEIHEDESFRALENIGQRLELGHTSYGPNWFRRYSAFWGPLERFVYLDVRQVVLMNLDPFVKSTKLFGLDFVYYDTALDQVYEPGPVRKQFLYQGGARGFLSNIWASRRCLFTLAEFEQLSDEILLVRDQMNQRNTDQAFINYCCDAKGVRMAKISDLLGNLVGTSWARQSGYPYRDAAGAWRLWDHGGLDHRKRLMLMHWAGQRFVNGISNRSVFTAFAPAPYPSPLRLTSRIARRSRLLRRFLGKTE